jgi:hypothetical protein
MRIVLLAALCCTCLLLVAVPGHAAAPAAGSMYRVRDTGIRCVRAPCFFMRARVVSTRKVVTVSELDLSHAHLKPGKQRAAQAALQSTRGLLVAGRIVRASDGGRSLRATKVFLSR